MENLYGRDPGPRPRLRSATPPTTARDYIYRGSQLLASSYPGEGIRHFNLDHLGTPRLVTASGAARGFYTLAPCRVLDTRNQTAPLSAGETRTVPLAGACGIPAGATAVSVTGCCRLASPWPGSSP